MDDFHKKDYYVSIVKNTVTVIDTIDGKTVRIPKEDYDKYNYYVTTTSKKIEIYNELNIIQHTIYGNFRKNCRTIKIPPELFEPSYKNNSKPIENHKKYSGWYAKEVK